jgi:hypothetical protein
MKSRTLASNQYYYYLFISLSIYGSFNDKFSNSETMNDRVNNKYLPGKGVGGYGNGLILGTFACGGLRKLT